MSKLTEFQMQVLGVVHTYGPLPTSEVDRHLLCGAIAARNAMVGLEKRGLISPHYTSHYAPATAYEITAAGEDAYDAEFGGDE